ncbi:MAG: lipid-A-disaccharide synthase [bacterium]|nr:lipid-A-disaccharide synthase [bacterium]
MKIGVIAGEKSGDNYGALLIEWIRKFEPDIFVIGTGGEGIRQKADLFIECPYGKMGFSGVITRLPLFYHSFQKVKEILEKENPAFIVFIDNPGFNLKLAGALGKKIPCFYYIPPKVWAHNYNRIRIIKRYIKAVITIFPFEQDIYKKENIPSFWFGHPVIDLIVDGPEERQEKEDIPVIGLLPGSREEEIKYLLPVFIYTVNLLSKQRKVRVLLSASDRRIKDIEEKILKRHNTEIEIIEGNPYNLIKKSALVLAGSGTVNLEVCLYRKPLLVFYKTSYFNYIIARLMVKLDMISPLNLILGEKVVPEYIQHFSYRAILDDIKDLLDKGILYKKQMDEFARLYGMMDGGSVSEKVAMFLLRGFQKDDKRDI